VRSSRHPHRNPSSPPPLTVSLSSLLSPTYQPTNVPLCLSHILTSDPPTPVPLLQICTPGTSLPFPGAPLPGSVAYYYQDANHGKASPFTCRVSSAGRGLPPSTASMLHLLQTPSTASSLGVQIGYNVVHLRTFLVHLTVTLCTLTPCTRHRIHPRLNDLLVHALPLRAGELELPPSWSCMYCRSIYRCLFVTLIGAGVVVSPCWQPSLHMHVSR
jgi:hypothetical protein